MTKTNQKIPEGWSVKKLGECFSFLAGGDVDKSSFSEVRDELHPYPIFANALTKRGLYGYSSKYKIKDECITITGRGDIGKVFYRKGFFTPIVRLITAIPRKNINAKFMSFSCECIKFWNETTGVPQLTIPQVQRYKILLPPLAEQKKIAEILSCWDEGIEKLSELIEKKKIQKKALMQQLLTGKNRLKGFSKPWKNVKLKNVCNIIKGSQLGKLEMLDNGSFPVMNGGVIPSGLTDSFNQPENTITISEGGNSCGFISLIKEKFWCGGHCYALKNLKMNLFFLFQILKSKESSIMKLRVGSGLPNIQRSSIENFSFYIPETIEEQKAIADILSKADEEIELLNKKLAAFKLEKKALMQKLLTGKIRVKVN